MSHANHQIVGGALSLGLGLALWLWLIPNWVEPDPDLRLPVDLVPRILAIGFVLCGLATIASGFLAKEKVEGIAPHERRGFVLMLILLVGATVGFQLLHFLVVAPVLVALAMWMFGPVRPISLVLTSALGPLVIWFIGTELLGRVLP